MSRTVSFSGLTIEIPKVESGSVQTTAESPATPERASELLLFLVRGICEAQQCSVQELLDAGANVNHQDKYGNTPLIIAAHNGRVELVKSLVSNGADLNLQDNRGNTALMAAIENGKLGVAEFLIENGVNVDHRNNQQKTALNLALASPDSLARRREKIVNKIIFTTIATNGRVELVENLNKISQKAATMIILFSEDESLKSAVEKTNLLNAKETNVLRRLRDTLRGDENFKDDQLAQAQVIFSLLSQNFGKILSDYQEVVNQSETSNFAPLSLIRTIVIGDSVEKLGAKKRDIFLEKLDNILREECCVENSAASPSQQVVQPVASSISRLLGSSRGDDDLGGMCAIS